LMLLLRLRVTGLILSGAFIMAPCLGETILSDLDRQTRPALPRVTSLRKLIVEGRQRYYELFLPPRLDPTKSAPLILSFHGAGANPKGWATLSKFNEQGGPLGFVIAYPAGYKGFWHAGDDCCGPPLNENIDDVAFVRAVIDDVAAIIKVDPDRIFAAGFSNGG